MLSDNVRPIDADADFEDGNYKSCFARSVVVNSHYQQTKNEKQLQHMDDNNSAVGVVDTATNRGDLIRDNKLSLQSHGITKSITKMRRDCFYLTTATTTTTITNDNNRDKTSCLQDSRRSSTCSSRIAEMPVENLVLKSQIETLQWQLKQTEASREMYRAVMRQIVTFLERAHRSLQVLGSRLNNNTTRQQTVPRSQSDYNMIRIKDHGLELSKPSIDASTDYTSFRDFTWRRQKKPQPSTEEVPPEKLSQEAFRLLRTAQSLLNTRAPDLAHLNSDTSEDLRFLEQLAKEFPRQHDNETHRPDSRCSSLQFPTLLSDKEIRISTALNRKLSLQQNKCPFRMDSPFKSNKSFDMHPPSSDCDMLSSTLNSDFNADCRSSINSHKSYVSDKAKSDFKLEPEKSNSPPMSSVSSVEDESGFSSMNSFQELGIPLINPIPTEEKTTKEALLKSMLQEGNAEDCLINENTKDPRSKDSKLWHKPDDIVSHKRWSSVPIDDSNLVKKQPLKVLWV